jgi:hypothetical protein
MQVERRRKRSSYTALALQYWLCSIAQRKRLFALVLADSAGLLVAASFHGPEAEELAAVAPLLARPADSGQASHDRSRIPIVIHRLPVDHASLFLCAVGDRERSRDGIRLAADGVHRILTVH